MFFRNYFSIRTVAITVAAVVVVGAASGVQAQQSDIPSPGDALDQAGQAANYRTEEANSTPFVALAQAVGSIISILFALLGVIFLILMVYAGWLWLMAGGSEEQVSRAKALIRQSVIGIVIIVGAYALTYFVLEQLAPFNENLQGFR